jgi:hypothetical protein
VLNHLDRLTKPPGSLGALETLALRLALIYGDPPPRLVRRTVFVLAADHGVTRHGVSAYPSEVTAQMCRNYAAGGAAVSALARSVGAEVAAVDIGVDADLSDVAGLIHRKVRRGSSDLSQGPALTATEVDKAIGVGIELVEKDLPIPAEVKDACGLLGLDPLQVANEGKLIAIVAADDADEMLAAMRQHARGAGARRIGTCVADHRQMVVARTGLGSSRNRFSSGDFYSGSAAVAGKVCSLKTGRLETGKPRNFPGAWRLHCLSRTSGSYAASANASS